MGRRNASTEFLKECIADALIKCMREKPFEKNTIQELAGVANVGRATYFRNFSSKDQVLTFKLICLWERWAKERDIQETDKYSMDHAVYFFQFIYSIRDLYRLICSCGRQAVIYDAFYQIMMPPPNATPLQRYRNRFLSYGLFGLLDEWGKRDFAESPEEMADMVMNRIL